ncbi:MAG TPA: ABC transporter permease [Burkholderiales bacterium]|jgi:ABC-type transport system involved in multi-copper enzyme maturation permease subunit|nr:ABC transporter permease [Burkholderiales bacterium]
MRPIWIIARFALLEALRSGLPLLALGCIAASIGFAAVLAHSALTETRELQATAAAAMLRISAAFLIGTYVVASVAREANDRGLELVLALPISRSAYYAGKLAGFACAAALLAASFASPLLLWSGPGPLGLWALSLATETALVAAMGLFFSMALTQVVPAIAATAGLYVLARSVSAIQAIAAGPLAQGQESALRGIVDALALLLPRLDQATRTEWLVYGLPSAGEPLGALAGLAIYFALLAAAGLFDFSRRNL